MRKLKFAAVDIGSNACRLLFCNVFENGKGPIFKKAFLIRVPLRLGDDAFTKKIIPPKKINRLVQTLKAFKLLIEINDVVDYRICATSALREAENQLDILKKVKKETGLSIEVVQGSKEARIIYSNHIEQKLSNKKPCLYIDVGGGSTEISLFVKGKMISSRSFNIGAIRLLKKMVDKKAMDNMKEWVKQLTKGHHPLMAIGSGGNINKLFNMWHKEEGHPFSYSSLNILYKYIKSFNVQDRQTVLGLNTDRADVIVPAAEIYLKIMKAAGIKKMMVPKIGVADGMVHLLYEKYKKTGSVKR